MKARGQVTSQTLEEDRWISVHVSEAEREVDVWGGRQADLMALPNRVALRHRDGLQVGVGSPQPSPMVHRDGRVADHDTRPGHDTITGRNDGLARRGREVQPPVSCVSTFRFESSDDRSLDWGDERCTRIDRRGGQE